MRKTLRWNMIFWIWGTTVLVVFLLLFLQFWYSEKQIKEDIRESGDFFAKCCADKFEEYLFEASSIANINAIYLETNKNGEEYELKSYLRNILIKNDYIYGSCIAFEPYMMSPLKHFFAPYYYLKDGKAVFVDLGTNEYDYINKDWYRIPKEKNTPMWSEPYFDTGGGNTVMITYSVPFYRNGLFTGITTVDIPLMKLTEEIKKIKVLDVNTGYIFIIDKKGTFLSFPDENQILKGNIYSINSILGEKMASGKPDFIRTFDPLRREDAWIVFYPIEISGFSVAIVYPHDEVMAKIYSLQNVTIFCGILGLFILLIVIIVLSNSIIRPVAQLVEAVKRLAKGNLEEKVCVDTSTYEVYTLELSFNKMIDDLKKHIEENRLISIEKERMENELAMAHKIQMSVLPQKFPAFPDRKDIDVFGKTLPALEVGGDFYDFFFIDKDHLAFVIGDASGKGMPAAIFMAVSRAFLKAVALQGLAPGECLKYSNDLLCGEDYLDMFITIFYGVLNTKTGQLQYSNGGHNPPYIIKNDGSVEPLQMASGPALGMVEDVDYRTVSISMVKGLFLYSDGVTEAENINKDLFSAQRLKMILEGIKDFSPEKVVSIVYEEVEKFSSGAPQSDDITLVALTYNP